jgi:OmpA-OmpF porin, OOP family
MKNTPPLLAAICAAALSISATAQVQQRDFRAVEGTYVGGAFGAFGARATGIDLKAGPSSTSKNGSGGKLFAGFQLTENFGVEVGGLRSSTLKRTFVVNGANVAQKGDINAFYLAGTGRLPIGERFAATTRLGFARSKFSGTNVLPTASAITGSKSGLMFGVGGEYRFTPKIGATLDYDYLPKTSKHLKSGLLSLGVKVSF